MMYSQANLMAILPSMSLPSLIQHPQQHHSNCCSNLPMNNLSTTVFHPYLLSPSMMPSKSQILAEMEIEYHKLKFLETLLYTSPPTGYLSNSTPSLPSALSLSSIPQQSLQYPIATSNTPTSSSNFCPSSPASTPLSVTQINENEKNATPHSPIPGSSASTASSLSSDRPHRCNECGKRFKFKSNLFEHKSLHSSQQTYQYVCPFCTKSCRLKGNLKKHLQIHMGTAEQLEKFWKARFSRSSGRPRKVVSVPQSPSVSSEPSEQPHIKDFLIDIDN